MPMTSAGGRSESAWARAVVQSRSVGSSGGGGSKEESVGGSDSIVVGCEISWVSSLRVMWM